MAAAVDKVTSTISKLDTKDESPQEVKSAETSTAEIQTQADSDKAENSIPETAQSETPKTSVETRPKSSEVRPGASWANIARGPANAPIESN